MFRLLVVSEGPTDKVMIEAAVANHVDDFVVTVLQPESSQLQGDTGGLGTGWKGVRRWCGQVLEQGGLGQVLSAGDTLVIHLDADVAGEVEIACEKPCPPPSATTDGLRTVMLGWLGMSQLPPRAVFCTPSKATESWSFVALYPSRQEGKEIECRPNPAKLLVGRSERLVRAKGDGYKKDTRAYIAASGQFQKNWKLVVRKCTEAAKFDSDLRTAIANH